MRDFALSKKIGSKRKFLFFLSFIYILLTSQCLLSKGNSDVNIESRLKILTFWTDFVSIKWYFRVSLSNPSNRMIIVIPEDVISGNLSSFGIFEIEKQVDLISNSTIFSIETPLPLGAISDDFPNDKYEATYFMGCNFLDKNVSMELGANIPGPTSNYQATWTLSTYPEFFNELKEIPSSALDQIKDMTCWFKLRLSIFHRQPFPEYVGILVNQVPLCLNIFGWFLGLTVFLSIICEAILSRSRKVERVTLIENIVVPISIAIIVFIPVYLLALHAFEAPLLIPKMEKKIIDLLYLYVGILITGVVTRIIFSVPKKTAKTTQRT